MFSKLSAMLQHAAEVTSQMLSPQASPAEEFQLCWRVITDTLSSENESVNSMHCIKSHLDQMIDLLCKEDEQRDQRGMGPCMEFMLRHRILDMLFTSGKSDYPCGMRREVLVILTVLLGRMQQPLIPHVSIHQPIQRLIAVCGENPTSPEAVEEVQFLRTLCLQVQRDSFMADFFIEDRPSTGKKHFLVLEALLRLVNCQDSVVAMKAYECLLLISGMPHSGVVESLVGSSLPTLLASHLQFHFQLIPPSCPSSQILACSAGWGVDYAARGSAFGSTLTWHMDAYLSWLDYCEQFVSCASENLKTSVCDAITEVLLRGSLLSRLTQASEEDLQVSLSVVTRSLQVLISERILRTFVCFLLCSDGQAALQHRLIGLCNHLSDDVCQSALQLFDVLLPLPSVVNSLLFCYWHGEVPANQFLTDEELFKERERLEDAVDRYSTVVPGKLCSCAEVTGESGIELYLLEAHRQVAYYRSISVKWEGESGEEGDASALVWGESPFLSGMTSKLEAILDQPYEINLLVTAILSKVACLSHPMVDQWMDYRQTSSVSLLSVLQKVSRDLQAHSEHSPGLLLNLLEARRRLLGLDTSDLLSMPHNNLLEGAVVLEEFVKEVASIIFAKKSSELLSINYQ